MKLPIALAFGVLALGPSITSAQEYDVAGVEACSALVDVLNRAADTRSLPARSELTRLVGLASRSRDPYLRQSMIVLRDSTPEHVVNSVRVVSDVCQNRIFRPAVEAHSPLPQPIAPPTPPPPPAQVTATPPPPGGGLTNALKRATESMQRFNSELREMNRLRGVTAPAPEKISTPAATQAPSGEPQGRQITEQEAERQVRGVLDRSGAQGAKCEKKQYGSGWVTVCE